MNASASLQIEVRARGSDRVLAAGDLPLGIGGAGAGIVATGVESGVVAATLGADGQGLFVEPGSADATLNGLPLTERSRLAHGDVVGAGDALIFFLLDGPRVRVHLEEAQHHLTAPPVIDEETADAALEEDSDTQSIQRASFRPIVQTGGKPVVQSRSRRWMLGASVGVLAFILWFLMTSTSVHVIAQPADAKIDFTGAWFELGIGEHYLLRPGDYTLTAGREGYETTHQPVAVSAEAGQQVRVSLRKLPGQVRVDTGGIAATLEVDGKPLGALPGEYRIDAGKHEFKIIAPRYQDLVQPVEVQGAGRKQTVALKLKPAFSAVSIDSKPAGARIAVDGKDMGVTPLTVEIDAGAHTLTLDAAGFRRWESSIQVHADEAQKIGPIELGLPDGKLIVRTVPTGADVTVSGRYRGRSPVEVSLSPGMEHSVEITRAGYEPARRSAAVKPAVSTTLGVELTPILGDVTVRGEPADALLFVDGTPRGPANQSLKLPSTELKVEIRRDGYVTYSTAVTPQPGVPRVVEYRLLTPAQAQAARTPALIKTSLGAELRLMPVGNFEMGSSRRDAGSRSNESQRAVTLQRPFYLGVKEVTNAEFRKFQADHMSGIVKNRSLDQDNHPVVNVTWKDAVDFCNWLSTQEGLPPAYEQKGDFLVLATPVKTGYRLPTEAEWEWGARHQPGSATLRFYQWGNSLPIPRNTGNYADKSSLLVLKSGLEGYEDGFVTTAPVGSFSPNSLGLFDMDGNVTEWVNDYYTVYRELDKGAATDPLGPESGERRVIRGASWRTTDVTELRLAWRESFDGKDQYIGFRIARYAQ